MIIFFFFFLENSVAVTENCITKCMSLCTLGFFSSGWIFFRLLTLLLVDRSIHLMKMANEKRAETAAAAKSCTNHSS